jgi:hypothetical protein
MICHLVSANQLRQYQVTCKKTCQGRQISSLICILKVSSSILWYYQFITTLDISKQLPRTFSVVLSGPKGNLNYNKKKCVQIFFRMQLSFKDTCCPQKYFKETFDL